MRPRPSANLPPADTGASDPGNPFLPPRRPASDCWAVLVSATLIASILILGTICLDMLLPDGLAVWIVPTITAVIRWPALFAMPAIVAVLAFSGRKDRP